MKTLLFTLSLLISAQSFASDETLSLIEDKVKEVQHLETKDLAQEKEKKNVLSKILNAKKGYAEWKRENPNHKEIVKEFKRVMTLITTKGSPENVALKKSLQRCKETPEICASNLKSNIESIYTNSEIPVLSKVNKFSVVSSAYASGSSISGCSSDFGYDGKFYLGLFGANETCGLTFYGAGLGYMVASYYVRVCTGDATKNAVGLFADVSAVVGVGTALTIGKGGVCQMFNANVVGAGAFVGLVVVDGEEFH